MEIANDFSLIEDAQRNVKAMLLLLFAYQQQECQRHGRFWEVLATEGSLINSGFTTEVIRRAETQGYLIFKQVLNVEGGVKLIVPAVTLTEPGAALAAAVWGLGWQQSDLPAMGTTGTNGRRRQKPRWDRHIRTLYYGDTLISRFRREAPNQMCILDAFQELRWPARIDDPLPPRGGVDRRERLHDAIKNLNRGVAPWSIRFAMEADGQGVRWSEGRGVRVTEIPG
ncbi:MAG TPA: hypothetical protein VN688_22115 [Gemmataceae bacterium]|nr:hypothetical protein [Gemmataceae bacterium]